MAGQKKGIIARMLEGKEKSEEYARSTLPTNRWQLFFDIFKGNFGKIVKVNLLILLFFIPILLIAVGRGIIDSSNGEVLPLNGATGIVRFPAYSNVDGVMESYTMRMNFMTFMVVTIATFIASVGLSGGMYVVRNMVWTEGIFVVNDFWRGVKLNYKNALATSLFFTVFLTIFNAVIDLANLALIAGELSSFQRFGLNFSIVSSIVGIIVVGAMSIWMIALGVNYEQKFFAMVRNSFLLFVGTLPQTLFFAVIALVPFALLFVSIQLLSVIGSVCIVFFGFSYALLVWLDFAQWTFDKYINPKISGAKVGRGIYGSDGTSTLRETDSKSSIEYQRALLAGGKSKLVARPIKPIDDSLQIYELPQSFTRDDLRRLKESKQNIAEDSAQYEEEHKNDLKYVEYNKKFEEREKALQDATDKKKKPKPPKLLGQ